MIRYGIPIYSQVDKAQQAINALLHGTVVPDEIVIIDNSEQNLVMLNLVEPKTDKTKFAYIIRTKNILSGAWNDFMRRGAADDHLILANDDVTPHENTIEELVRAADENPQIAMFSGSINDGNSYSFFLLRKWAYDQVGAFDEKFIPAYYEDNDYDYRLRTIHGLARVHVETVNYDHAISATYKAMNAVRRRQHDVDFMKNQRYYISKWGGMPGKEKYMIPFAGVDLSDI